ncbi:UDP-4-amino-4,6-dideoxy-N-acetyl-beta-L-altrosamine transaminase [Helicobacter pylori]|uniref:UDP-4-amino-4, 6-dideoxy-N-acetyl-beta-L-altrosamine transaminase n=1 Tax=Helicobacter pylori TaxID=210 RepID=UPI0004D713E9|nr:UDP-4-amino-4,6-dideoxy-N-acetyl-beta-L-altrosamine transaminase [Helicobacter pylori]KAA6495626.1 UDP-4-amino-4,6-dideoxy-N-acetyl-beta-L-altrosamine transaminase [Helicobacter pylori]KAA6505327.1 UDP-4-amino-4,6-dideoxy-N-acetyl-beta-L-altrosamine transaminase [Helicobacter pylori]KEY39662.1 UDP-4-amino-4,6-dideoxy-N-acetyl-beta-L-altrosamine aminotransferase [Helicobacter pylori]OOC16345.1 UDP-4-amino-4,6-dideoxy-N-acetyl-beta-L-altrosamine transaminase [Helicobacter pylori]OOC23612.1 UD
MKEFAYSEPCLDEEDKKAVLEVLNSKQITQGKRSLLFEEALCEFLGVKHALAFNSATSALLTLYRNFSDFSADCNEIITTPMSFVATANMLLESGYTPVFAGIKNDGNIDELALEKLITKKTKAIVSVDYAGKSVEIESIQELCKKHSLSFLSDSSHALGSEYQNKKVGGFALASVFSFHAIKPITTAEGGAVVTNDSELYEKMKLFRSHGMLKKDFFEGEVKSIGHNFRLNEIQSALGLSQLKKAPLLMQKREEVALVYDRIFKDNPYFTPLHPLLKDKSSNHLYPILMDQKFFTFKRSILESLHKLGILAQVHYKPIYQYQLYQQLFNTAPLKSAEDFYNAEISLPCHANLNLESVQNITHGVLKTFEGFNRISSV